MSSSQRDDSSVASSGVSGWELAISEIEEDNEPSPAIPQSVGGEHDHAPTASVDEGEGDDRLADLHPITTDTSPTTPRKKPPVSPASRPQEGQVYVRADGKKVRRVRKPTDDASASGSSVGSSLGGTPKGEVYVRADGKRVRRVKRSGKKRKDKDEKSNDDAKLEENKEEQSGSSPPLVNEESLEQADSMISAASSKEAAATKLAAVSSADASADEKLADVVPSDSATVETEPKSESSPANDEKNSEKSAIAGWEQVDLMSSSSSSSSGRGVLKHEGSVIPEPLDAKPSNEGDSTPVPEASLPLDLEQDESEQADVGGDSEKEDLGTSDSADALREVEDTEESGNADVQKEESEYVGTVVETIEPQKDDQATPPPPEEPEPDVESSSDGSKPGTAENVGMDDGESKPEAKSLIANDVGRSENNEDTDLKAEQDAGSEDASAASAYGDTETKLKEDFAKTSSPTNYGVEGTTSKESSDGSAEKSASGLLPAFSQDDSEWSLDSRQKKQAVDRALMQAKMDLNSESFVDGEESALFTIKSSDEEPNRAEGDDARSTRTDDTIFKGVDPRNLRGSKSDDTKSAVTDEAVYRGPDSATQPKVDDPAMIASQKALEALTEKKGAPEKNIPRPVARSNPFDDPSLQEHFASPASTNPIDSERTPPRGNLQPFSYSGTQAQPFHPLSTISSMPELPPTGSSLSAAQIMADLQSLGATASDSFLHNKQKPRTRMGPNAEAQVAASGSSEKEQTVVAAIAAAATAALGFTPSNETDNLENEPNSPVAMLMKSKGSETDESANYWGSGEEEISTVPTEDSHTTGGRLWEAATAEAERMSQEMSVEDRSRFAQTLMARTRSRADPYPHRSLTVDTAAPSMVRIDENDRFLLSTALARKRVRVVQLLLVGLLALLVGFLGDFYVMSSCHFVSADVEVGQNDQVFKLHYGLWKYSPMDSVFQGYSYCTGYDDSYTADAPLIPRIGALLAMISGVIAIVVVWVYLVFGRAVQSHWRISILLAAVAGIGQALTLAIFYDAVCQRNTCTLGGAGYLSVACTIVWFVLSFEMYYNMPMAVAIVEISSPKNESPGAFMANLEMTDFEDGLRAFLDRVTLSRDDMPSLNQAQRENENPIGEDMMNMSGLSSSVKNGSYKPPMPVVGI